MKRGASSDSDTEDMPNLIIWARVRSGPLLNGMRTSSERKMWAPDWLWDLLFLRKEESECPARIMLLVR